jgi:hypothetical protein
LLAGGLAVSATAASAGNVRVITNGSSPTAALDEDFLRAVFTMRLREWPDGTPIRVFVLSDRHALHEEFCRERLKTYPYVLRTVWSRLVFTGTGLAPVTVASEDEMRRSVRGTRGGIGYVRAGGEPRQGAVQVVPPQPGSVDE